MAVFKWIKTKVTIIKSISMKFNLSSSKGTIIDVVLTVSYTVYDSVWSCKDFKCIGHKAFGEIYHTVGSGLGTWWYTNRVMRVNLVEWMGEGVLNVKLHQTKSKLWSWYNHSFTLRLLIIANIYIYIHIYIYNNKYIICVQY